MVGDRLLDYVGKCIITGRTPVVPWGETSLERPAAYWHSIARLRCVRVRDSVQFVVVWLRRFLGVDGRAERSAVFLYALGHPVRFVHIDQEGDYKIVFVAENFESFIRGLEDDSAFEQDA